MRRAPASIGLLIHCFVLSLAAGAAVESIRLLSGGVELPSQAVGGGEVILEIGVAGDGSVSDVMTLRSTPPYTESLKAAVEGWRFSGPAGRLLVAAVFRPPTLHDEPTLGEAPKDLAEPTPLVPFPTTIVTPSYPPAAVGDAAVVVRAQVTGNGSVSQADTIVSAPGFDAAALSAARQWRFRPAGGARPVPGVALLVFGFRVPVAPPLER